LKYSWGEAPIFICTDNFTLAEVDLLIKVIKENFNLLVTKKRRIKANKGASRVEELNLAEKLIIFLN
jgi:hypothetical protein